MGFNHLAGGGIYGYGAEGATSMETLPIQGRLRTASYTGTTDSAASATAMSTGFKTWNGYLGVSQGGLDLLNIREEAASEGLKTGVVTTDTLTGATPSAFLVHIDERGDSSAIADEIALDVPDVLLGGGSSVLEPALAAENVQWLYTQTELLNWVDDGRPVVGVFASGTLPYVADGVADVPTLAEMTSAAISKLSQDDDGFFLMVEGARIDHASHSNDEERVYPEVVAFDEAIAETLAWAATQENVTVLVTADHECGGIWHDGGSQGVIPTTYWRWGMHTNADVPVFAMGDAANVLNGQRLDNTWIHSVLKAALYKTEPQMPLIGPIPDGYIEEFNQVVAQSRETDFGTGYNQLDGLRVSADELGLWVGLDGVFEYGENTVLILLDMDYGAGTGVGVDGIELSDTIGTLDTVWTTTKLAPGISGLGFDAGIGAMWAEEVTLETVGTESTGFRGFYGDFGTPEDIWWLESVVSFDDGNVADYAPAGDGVAKDADITGATLNGLEAWVPWWSIFPNGLPASQRIAVAAVLVNDDGSKISNQVLPPQSVEEGVGEGTLSIESVVVMELDGLGRLSMAPYLEP
jgi:alkaline phosphatase